MQNARENLPAIECGLCGTMEGGIRKRDQRVDCNHSRTNQALNPCRREASKPVMKLKSTPEDFQVVEQIALQPTGGLFALYTLTKQSLGTPEALAAVERRWGLT